MQSYRKNNDGKYLYALMDEAGTTWIFIALAVFETAVPKPLVLIAEAIMCSLFASYAPEVYREFRLSDLSYTDLDVCVNRSNPLEVEGHVLTNGVRNKYTRTLANALAGGPGFCCKSSHPPCRRME